MIDLDDFPFNEIIENSDNGISFVENIVAQFEPYEPIMKIVPVLNMYCTMFNIAKCNSGSAATVVAGKIINTYKERKCKPLLKLSPNY